MSTACIILAGGLGTRLRGTVQNLPKCLAPIKGKPFLEWQLCSLAERGVDRFILALGYGSQAVLKTLRASWARHLNIEVVIENDLLGTGGAARFAMDESYLEEALVANGDTYLGGNISEMLLPLDLKNGELMRIATVYENNRFRFGGISVNKNNRVIGFIEKGNTDSGLINAGLYRIRRVVLDGAVTASFSMEADIMPRLVYENSILSQEIKGSFIDIGVPEDYHHFNKFIQNYI